MMGRGVFLAILVSAVGVGACGGSGKRPPLEEVPIDYGPTHDEPVATTTTATTTTATATASASASAAPQGKNGTKRPKKR